MILPKRRYAKLVLVGHSEGAVVIRRAVATQGKKFRDALDSAGASKAHQAALEGQYQILSGQLKLFAPAIRGFTPSGWIGAALAIGRIAAFADPLLHYSTAFVEMKDKTILDDLKEDTVDLLNKVAWIPALRAHVVYGSKEHVVARGEYPGDMPERPESGQSHTSICKPRPSYQMPLRFVAGEKGQGVPSV